MSGPFGWARKGEPTPSEVFVQSLPAGPLRAHLGSLHALFLHVQSKDESRLHSPERIEASKNELQLFEHHLRHIALSTRIDPAQAEHLVRRYQDQKAQPRVRKQFKKITEKEK